MTETPTFAKDIWYFAGISSEIKTGKLIRRVIASEPITLGRKKDGTVFALRDICPHRAAPFSGGRLREDDTVECPYHGWRFGASDGACKQIPALPSDSDIQVDRIKVRTYPIKEQGHLVWVYLSTDPKFDGEPECRPPHFDIATQKPRMHDSLTLSCNVDHAFIGLVDPAHGPYVHQNWWWRSQKSMHDKSKAYEPRELGFAMAAHSPSSNSFAYKLLGGKPVTEITLRFPGIRTEEIKVGKRTLLSMTVVTPIDEVSSNITQVFFTDMRLIKILTPVLRVLARKFLRQDVNIIELQKLGLAHDPRLLLIGDADVQAKWYYAIKKEWAESRAQGRAFKNPVKAQTLRWRS